MPEFDGEGSLVPLDPPKLPMEEESGSGGEESGEEDEEYGNIHLVELHKGVEPLGIQFTHYTSPDNM